MDDVSVAEHHHHGHASGALTPTGTEPNGRISPPPNE
jgi:hypothetical protein